MTEFAYSDRTRPDRYDCVTDGESTARSDPPWRKQPHNVRIFSFYEHEKIGIDICRQWKIKGSLEYLTDFYFKHFLLIIINNIVF